MGRKILSGMLKKWAEYRKFGVMELTVESEHNLNTPKRHSSYFNCNKIYWLVFQNRMALTVMVQFRNQNMWYQKKKKPPIFSGVWRCVFRCEPFVVSKYCILPSSYSGSSSSTAWSWTRRQYYSCTRRELYIQGHSVTPKKATSLLLLQTSRVKFC